MAFSASYSWQAATDPCTLDSVDFMWLRTLDVRKSDKAQEKKYINQNIRYTDQGSWILVGNTDEVSNMSSIMDRRCRSCFFWIESAEDYLEIKNPEVVTSTWIFFEVEISTSCMKQWGPLTTTPGAFILLGHIRGAECGSPVGTPLLWAQWKKKIHGNHAEDVETFYMFCFSSPTFGCSKCQVSKMSSITETIAFIWLYLSLQLNKAWYIIIFA